MTVLIKGMKMPNGCVDCIFCWPGDADAYCIAQSYHKETGGTHNHKIQSDYGIGYEEQKTWREPTCPLLKVKTPHGRLIDAGQTVHYLVFDEEHEEWINKERTVEEYLSYCDEKIPTVIESEDEE